MAKTIPSSVMHKPKNMVWAELTTLSEHKKRIADGIKPEIVSLDSSIKTPLPLSRATTELRRAYPYIFDCAAYAKTHNPEKIETDLFYSRFEMPYKIFLEYCLDDCTEQTGYLKSEIYRLMGGDKGQKAKYIKVSPDRTVFALPVIISFSHTDLKTGKEKRINNIGHDAKVDMVQIQILKELLDFTHGYINWPKAFYAKTRRIYNNMLNNVRPLFDAKDDYRKAINVVKSMATSKITTQEAARLIPPLIKFAQETLADLEPEQGGFYKIYKALDHIVANKKRNSLIKNNPFQTYDFIKLCEKCTPEYTQNVNGTIYLRKIMDVYRYNLHIQSFLEVLPEADKRIIGIKNISEYNEKKQIEVEFYPIS